MIKDLCRNPLAFLADNLPKMLIAELPPIHKIKARAMFLDSTSAKDGMPMWHAIDEEMTNVHPLIILKSLSRTETS
jgi:hypothetical protein